MKHTTPQHHSQDKTNDPLSRGYVRPKAGPSYTDPLDYPSYPYPCMRDFARLLATRYDSNRTRHGYYRHLRLLHEQLRFAPVAFPGYTLVCPCL